jgi:hypothetical protein
MSFELFISNFCMIFGEVQFFFSGLTAGPTYQPPVRHSNPDTPLNFYSADLSSRLPTQIVCSNTSRQTFTKPRDGSGCYGRCIILLPTTQVRFISSQRQDCWWHPYLGQGGIARWTRRTWVKNGKKNRLSRKDGRCGHGGCCKSVSMGSGVFAVELKKTKLKKVTS